VNTTTVTDTEEFRAPASELYKTFTDPQRIAAFTRAAPKTFEGAKKGGKFELFGGNVSGEYLELDEPKKIVQSWRLDQWPPGHYSRLEINFDQNDVDNVTVMRVSWSGVPIGQEDVTKRNWSEYYVRSIKQTFGYARSPLPILALAN
jgi:activator of HSP90 ATPase